MRESRKKEREKTKNRTKTHTMRNMRDRENMRERKRKTGWGARNDRRAVVQSSTKYKKESVLGGCVAVAKRGKRIRRIRRTPRNGAVEKREGYEKGRRERFERRVSPSARCFVRGGEKEGRRGSARRNDKNSPNPSLITMPAKSEILTAVAPRRATSR